MPENQEEPQLAEQAAAEPETSVSDIPVSLSPEEKKRIALHTMLKRCLAEMIGTAVLVIVGCGAAMGLSIGEASGSISHITLAIGTALAFGLVVTALSYALGEYSGCHTNPAVTWALYLDKKIGLRQMLWYWAAQFIGGVLGGLVLLLFFGTGADVGAATETVQSFASNTVNITILGSSWGVEATSLYSAEGWPFIFIGLFAEIFFAFVFIFTILCTGHKKENSPISGMALGLSLVAVILLGFNITGTGVNPARSLGTALVAMVNGVYEPISEIWIFIVGPMVGATLAELAYRGIWHPHGAHAPHSRYNPFHRSNKSENKAEK